MVQGPALRYALAVASAFAFFVAGVEVVSIFYPSGSGRIATPSDIAGDAAIAIVLAFASGLCTKTKEGDQ